MDITWLKFIFESCEEERVLQAIESAEGGWSMQSWQL